jgi:predicted RNase H-like nuclease
MTETVFIGIDPTAGKRPMNYAVLDAELGAVVLEATGGLMEVLSAVQAYPAAVVAVDAPQSPNSGLMASADYRARLSPPPAAGRWLGYKVCEYLLRQRGIGLYATPTDEAAAPSWMQVGFQLYAGLRAAGFERYRPGSAAPRQVLEVHPHACFTVLLGHLPTQKNLLEGRLQRQLVLYRAGVGVPDPMQALEELTAHHLLSGSMDLPGLLSHDALDALAAAYTANLAATAPEQVTLVGDPDEGEIILPIAPGELKPQYNRPDPISR